MDFDDSTEFIDLFSKTNKHNNQFMLYCEKNFVIENYHFIKTILDYKKTSDDKLKDKYKYIIKLFFSDDAIYQLNINSFLKNNILFNEITHNIFDDIYNEILCLIKYNVYGRFILTIKENNKKLKSKSKSRSKSSLYETETESNNSNITTETETETDIVESINEPIGLKGMKSMNNYIKRWNSAPKCFKLNNFKAFNF